jgi:PAS domain S-box-containing protein
LNENVLFISASKDIYSPIIQKLEDNNFNVQLESFENQINLCSTVARGTRDIILSDYEAWTRSGSEILKMIEERDLFVPYIIIGREIDEKTMISLIETGINDYIEEVNLHRLVPAIRREIRNSYTVKKLKNINFSQCLTEEKFQTLLNISKFLIYTLNLNTEFIDVNIAFNEFLGYDKLEILNSQNIYELIHPNDKKILLNGIQKVMEGSFVNNIEYRLKKKNETYLHLSSNLAPIFDNDNEMIGILFVSEDLTKSKKIQQSIEDHIHRQALIAQFGLETITEKKIDNVFKKATTLLAKILDVEYTKVLEILPDKKYLLLRTGVGWHEGLVGNATVENNKNSQAGFTLLTTAPVIAENLKTETRFCAPKLLADHDVISGMSVIIQGKNTPFGILGIHTKKHRIFSKDDINFLQSVANVLAGVIVRDSTEKELRESEEKYRMLTEQSLLGTLILANGQIIFANKGISNILGFSISELLSWDINTINQHIHPENRQLIVENYTKILNEEIPSFQSEIRMKKKNNMYLYIQQYSKRIQFQGSSALFINIIDISERKKNESLLEASLAEKEILLKEIHHRVKNNLQIISSLIVLQEQYIKDERILHVFKDFQNRIRVMALIHQTLYNSENLNKIHLSKYIKDLVNNLFKVYSADFKQIKFELNIEDIDFNLDNANACGLIINELVSNSLKHAFSENNQGKIVVTLKKIEEDKVLLDVYDNGVGFPDNVDYKNSDSLGLKLISTITKQMDGNISIERNNGTHVKITW